MSIRQVHFQRAQKGIILFVALILLLVLSLLGITLARTQTVEERLAQNEDNHQIAFQAAEAALHVAVDDLLSGSYKGITLARGVFDTETAGFYDISDTSTAWSPGSIVDVVNWGTGGVGTPAAVAAYDGAALASLPSAAQNPVFLIEYMPNEVAPQGLCKIGAGQANGQAGVYRITAHGWGGDGQATVTLQQIFYRC
jgi:type IV pilus assembly protein PilX